MSNARETLVGKDFQGKVDGVDNRHADSSTAPNLFQLSEGIIPWQDGERRIFGKKPIGKMSGAVNDNLAVLTIYPHGEHILYQTREGIAMDDTLSFEVFEWGKRAGVSDIATLQYLDTFVKTLKNDLIWPKMFAVYPFIGANANAHSKNLVTDVFNITWNGGMTHNTGGSLSNGTTGYGRCPGLTSTVHGALSGMSVYVRVADAVHNFARMIGSSNAAQTAYYSVDRVNLGGFQSERGCAGDVTQFITSVSVPARIGLFSINRTTLNASALYYNGASIGSVAVPDAGVVAAHDCFVFALNQAEVATSIAGCTMGLSAIHQGLDATESLNFYNAVQTLQTSLGRQV